AWFARTARANLFTGAIYFMDLLKRAAAPISGAAWDAIDEEATQALSNRLTARRFVDVDGPHGWEYTAVSSGRLALPGDQPDADGVSHGIYNVLPLIEFRVSFELNTWELDNIERGAVDINLAPVTEAARKAADFEDRIVFHGYQEGRVVGLAQSREYPPAKIAQSGGDQAMLDAISGAILHFQDALVGGPYALIAGAKPWQLLAASANGYPLRKRVERLIDGPVIYSPAAGEGAYLVSLRGGDFILSVGQDFSIGYEAHTAESVRLFLTESFTFRMLDPGAVIALEL
ncbi:MAG: family 1 encapsulin nanocompartment shell protein, partial [Leptospirales bacterium]